MGNNNSLNSNYSSIKNTFEISKKNSYPFFTPYIFL